MDKKRIINTYNSIATLYDEAFCDPSSHIEELLKLINKNSSILDIGCGAGNNSVYLSSLGYKVTGVDLSENMLSIAKNKNSNATFLKKDISNLDFKDQSFDHVVAAYSLCYLPKSEVLNCLKNLHRIIKNKGFIFIKLQEGASKEISIPEPFDNTLTLDLNVISYNEIEILLKKSLFSINEVYSDKKDSDDELSKLKELCIIAQKT